MKPAFRGALALALAFAAGVAMSFGQTYTPHALSPFFNSAAPVVAVAGFVAFTARRWWLSALIGAFAGPAVMAGYYVTSELRGFPGSASYIALWSTAGVIVGAAMGLGVWALRFSSSTPLKAAGASLWPGVAVGEAAFGLTANAETTPGGYWWAQAVLGVAALAAIAWYHLPTWAGRLMSLGFAAVVALAVFAAYGAR
ncbi:DUF6518 family protein [Demequina sp.]|uniref:DUF6518 family protein n=1 Tax=Demequina sp. TaxID=2050685 RepID=UPI003D0E050C